MVILFLLFLIQFSVACACLGVKSEQQEQLARQGWTRVESSTKAKVQEVFTCCGFDPKIDKEIPHPPCDRIQVKKDDYCIPRRKVSYFGREKISREKNITFRRGMETVLFTIS